jgi:hypothetical protein
MNRSVTTPADGGGVRLENPRDRLPNGRGRFKHGDVKDVAYRFNYMLYRKWIEIGELK